MSLLVWFLAFVNGWTALSTPQAPPVPVRIVTMGVELPSGTKATLSVPSGGRATVQAVDGPRLGLVPTLTEDGRVDLAVIENHDGFLRRRINPRTGPPIPGTRRARAIRLRLVLDRGDVAGRSHPEGAGGR